MKEFVIPRLKCELLGHHIENFKTDLRKIVKTPVGVKIRCRNIRRDIPGEKPSVELTCEQESVNIDIYDRNPHMLKCYPRLSFMRGVIGVNTGNIACVLGIQKDSVYTEHVTIGVYIKSIEVSRRHRELPSFFHGIVSKRSRKNSESMFTSARTVIKLMIFLSRLKESSIATRRGPYRVIEPAEKELWSLDLEERIYEIVYGDYEVMPSWCPEFAKVCEQVLKYSRMIIQELLKRGSSEPEEDSKYSEFSYSEDDDY